MSAMERITGADWAAWFVHLVRACISSMATSVQASLCTGAANATAAEAWVPSGNSYEALAWGAFYGFALGVAKYLEKNPFPTGDEVKEAS